MLLTNVIGEVKVVLELRCLISTDVLHATVSMVRGDVSLADFDRLSQEALGVGA